MAVKEVLRKVLSEPIRPHFAIACIGVEFDLEASHNLVSLLLLNLINLVLIEIEVRSN